ncbi:hypothetical protein [Streptomyces sp. NBC_00572]|uniref:hypothetical protein n=1 Tax=Streptomyces sp. NBC_00572 TaxID=2903664 RepID=UPI002257A8A7|nr:hypothetical protein [Streptomyces sp. NBC_00572]MCX4986402.1 hypothetical protein [Streptomyces sp. NBC_00572]
MKNTKDVATAWGIWAVAALLAADEPGGDRDLLDHAQTVVVVVWGLFALFATGRLVHQRVTAWWHRRRTARAGLVLPETPVQADETA